MEKEKIQIGHKTVSVYADGSTRVTTNRSSPENKGSTVKTVAGKAIVDSIQKNLKTLNVLAVYNKLMNSNQALSLAELDAILEELSDEELEELMKLFLEKAYTGAEELWENYPNTSRDTKLVKKIIAAVYKDRQALVPFLMASANTGKGLRPEDRKKLDEFFEERNQNRFNFHKDATKWEDQLQDHLALYKDYIPSYLTEEERYKLMDEIILFEAAILQARYEAEYNASDSIWSKIFNPGFHKGLEPLYTEYVVEEKNRLLTIFGDGFRAGFKFGLYTEVVNSIGTGKKPTKGSGKDSPEGLIGKEYEEWLTKNIGGDGSFSKGGRDFDGGVGNRWWEAKSGKFWEMLESDPKKLAKFKSDMGDRLNIAKQNGATYELYSNTPIPQSIKDWLTKKGIPFTETLR